MRRMHAVLLVLLLVGGLTRDVPLTSARAEMAQSADMAPARTSLLAQIQLPDGARRSTDRNNQAAFEAALRKASETSRSKSGAVESKSDKVESRFNKVEVLAWPADATPMQDLPSKLKDAGYAYSARPSYDAVPGRITPFIAARAGQNDTIQGMWIETDTKNVLLAWASCRSNSASGQGEQNTFELLPAERPETDGAFRSASGARPANISPAPAALGVRVHSATVSHASAH
ncbi:hypothetical protein CCAX7_29190 [Capsulimonas corticalis]|uniref:Uncharacterized protein n=1 Tax=Capsulimonas corticalis TaxID=2219043 RepID=A0A402CT28_9BACT|nr:hypothetical protein [Capsulimonas corticalis]BDI30868.1 hypothetical protein CCAX7_29190 [Capsulimonas corticalis]